MLITKANIVPFSLRLKVTVISGLNKASLMKHAQVNEISPIWSCDACL